MKPRYRGLPGFDRKGGKKNRDYALRFLQRFIDWSHLKFRVKSEHHIGNPQIQSWFEKRSREVCARTMYEEWLWLSIWWREAVGRPGQPFEPRIVRAHREAQRLAVANTRRTFRDKGIDESRSVKLLSESQLETEVSSTTL